MNDFPKQFVDVLKSCVCPNKGACLLLHAVDLISLPHVAIFVYDLFQVYFHIVLTVKNAFQRADVNKKRRILAVVRKANSAYLAKSFYSEKPR